jgi:hypothetical protein
MESGQLPSTPTSTTKKKKKKSSSAKQRSPLKAARSPSPSPEDGPGVAAEMKMYVARYSYDAVESGAGTSMKVTVSEAPSNAEAS